MSDAQALLLQSAERVFVDIAREEGDFASSWAKAAALGLDGLLTPEAEGGFGGDWADAFAVLRLAGLHTVALPVGEAMVAARIGAHAGFAPVDGLTTIAGRAEGVIDAKQRFTGQVEATPWGGDAAAVLFEFDGGAARASVSDARVVRRANPAGEPRDVLTFEAASLEQGDAPISVIWAGAFVRTAQIAGALDAALAMSIQYANDRVQFGKPIGKFQAVQQSLAVFAEEAAAVNSAGQAAAAALDRGDGAFEIAAAKLRANMAVGLGAATAHQVHGAIGFTQEHALHRYTRRLLSWRSEFGGDRYWAERLGADVCARGADAFWPFLTARSDSTSR
jgi:acyl-CoA dehydrogenase